jgi:hypothetical protein
MECLKLMVEFGCDVSIRDPMGLNAADYAFLFGQYPALVFLAEKGCERTKTIPEYLEVKESGLLKIPYVDYPCLEMTYDCKIPPEVAPAFNIPPPRPR